MPWQLFEAEPKSDINEVLNELTDFLPSIDVPGAIATAKIAAMNARKTAARGIVIYNTSLPIRNVGINCTNWQVKIFTLNDDFKRDLYYPALDFINSLSDLDAQSSIITMTDWYDVYSTNEGVLSVWWAQSQ